MWLILLFTMAWATPKRVVVASESVQKKMHYSLLLPADYSPQQSYPVLLLLHGLGGTDTGWRRSRLYKQLQAAMKKGELPPLIIVMPNGERGYWSNWVDGKHRYGDWVLEVLAHARQRYSLSENPQECVIAGISMGGFGALSLGLRNPKKFGGIVALSPTDMRIAVAKRPRYSVYVDLVGYPANLSFIDSINPVSLLQKGAGKKQRIALVYGAAEPAKFRVGALRLLAAAKEKNINIQTRVVPNGLHSFKSTWTPATMNWWIGHVGDWLQASKQQKTVNGSK